MTSWQLTATLAVIALAGLLRIVKRLRTIQERLHRALDFLDKYRRLTVSLPRIDGELYSELTKRSISMQRELGALGVAAFRPPFGDRYIPNYQLLLNILPAIRQGHADAVQIAACEDALIRFVGVLEDQRTGQSGDLANPLAWVREGVRLALLIPILLLGAVGLLRRGTVERISWSRFTGAFAALVTIVGLVGSVVTIALGWTPFLELLKDWLR
jgi:hypothetical protein